VEYFIASSAAPGAQARAHFASPEAPQPIAVQGETAETRLAERLARHRGHRSEFRLSGELTRYGRRHLERGPRGRDFEGLSDAGSDVFWATRLDYTHRLLGFPLRRPRQRRAAARAVAHLLDEARPADVAPGTAPPGVNYGQGGVRLELHRSLSVDANLLLGASERGFVAGVGEVLRVGRIAGTHFEAGVELLQDVGHNSFFRFAWDTVEGLPMALAVELQDRPGGDDSPLGTRLIYELGAELGNHVTITGRAGYAARTDATEAA
jgi:hypothetical protein